MSVLSPTFDLPFDDEYKMMKLAPSRPGFAGDLARFFGQDRVTADFIEQHKAVIAEADAANVPLRKRVLRAEDFLPEKAWKVLACIGYMGDDPYTGAHGVEQLDHDRYRVTTRLSTRSATSRITFTFRLKDTPDEARLVFQPLLVRFMSGADWTTRAVKISDSGRIRNELQTLISQALEYRGQSIRVRFEDIDERVLPKDKQRVIADVLAWYKARHPVWFEWLEIA
jgi:hypothetical protein